jgi:predicted ATPase/transcriptional regulator with XRE-family HTH domain
LQDARPGGSAIDGDLTFGAWLRHRRRALDLTREELAVRVGCSISALRKLEADDLRPSKPLAEILASALGIESENRTAFVRFARAATNDDEPSRPIPAASLNPSPVSFTVRFNLPAPATAMIGRETELAEIGDLLRQPETRLVMLTGPGGIGKTRLALATAAEQASRYPHGVWFVNLAPLSAAGGVVSAIADTFKLSGLGVGDPRAALRNYLREKVLLLVLDNFEHVLDAADLVADILASAPGVQILATSRERLRLRIERVYAVGGLSFPVDGERADANTFDAVRMFVAYVRHSHPQYTLAAADTPAVAQICRLAAGMPLGIELAAAWAPTLPVATIAAELAASLDVLETTLRDVPERHRSARAVFDHSWNLLTVEEQALFRQLAVFRGGFTFPAAQQIAGATLGTLARLVDTSLLRAERDGRYDVHELLRQFAEQKLGAEPGAATRTRERHSRFYLEWLRRKEPDLKGPQQLHALDEVECEFENVRSACDWALHWEQWERLRKSLRAFSFFMAVRARQLEAIALLQQVIDTVGAVESTIEESAQSQGLAAYALTSQSWFFARLGQIDKQVSCLERSQAAVQQYGTPYEIALHCHLYASSRADEEEAQALFARSLAFFRAIGETWDVAFVINGRGNFAFGRGETLKARELYTEALALWQASGELQGTANGLLNLGRVAYALGDYDQSRRLLEESLALQQAVGSKIRTAECLELLGENASAQRQFAAAEARFQQQIAILRDLGNRELLSWSLSGLGAAVLADRLSDVAGLLGEALTIAEGCGDRRGLARAHSQLGYLALQQGAFDTARRHWRTAVEAAWRVQDRAHLLVTLDALIGLATLMFQAGDAERAVELLTLVRGAASIDRRTETKAEQVLAELEGQLSPARFAAAQARGRAVELGVMVAAMLAEG